MTRAPLALALFGLLVLTACKAPPEPRQGGAGGSEFQASLPDWPQVPAERPPLLSPAKRLLAFTKDDRLALVDARSGAVLSTSALPVAKPARDVAYDPYRSRALVFASDDDAQAGRIEAFPIGRALGPPELIATLDGLVKLLAVPRGALMFERGYGDRWAVLDPSEPPKASLQLPMPASLAWKTEGQVLEAIVYDADGATSLVDVEVSAQLKVLRNLEVPAGSAPPTGRAIVLEGRTVLVDLNGDALTLRVSPHARELAQRVESPGFARAQLEAVAFVGAHTLAMLLSGIDQVVFVALDDELVVERWVAIPLEGAVAHEPSFFSRDLAVLGEGRLLVATSTGLLELEIARRHDRLLVRGNAELEGSELRGPIEVLPDP